MHITPATTTCSSAAEKAGATSCVCWCKVHTQILGLRHQNPLYGANKRIAPLRANVGRNLKGGDYLKPLTNNLTHA